MCIINSFFKYFCDDLVILILESIKFFLHEFKSTNKIANETGADENLIIPLNKKYLYSICYWCL